MSFCCTTAATSPAASRSSSAATAGSRRTGGSCTLSLCRTPPVCRLAGSRSGVRVRSKSRPCAGRQRAKPLLSTTSHRGAPRLGPSPRSTSTGGPTEAPPQPLAEASTRRVPCTKVEEAGHRQPAACRAARPTSRGGSRGSGTPALPSGSKPGPDLLLEEPVDDRRGASSQSCSRNLPACLRYFARDEPGSWMQASSGPPCRTRFVCQPLRSSLMVMDSPLQGQSPPEPRRRMKVAQSWQRCSPSNLVSHSGHS